LNPLATGWLVHLVASLDPPLGTIEVDRDQSAVQAIPYSCLDPHIDDPILFVLLQVGDQFCADPLLIIKRQTRFGWGKPETTGFSSSSLTSKGKGVPVAKKETAFW